MIDWMQKNRKFLVPTLWISAIAFIGSGAVGWGAYKYGGSGADTIATVGDREITHSDLQASVNNIYNYYNNLFGGKFTKEMAAKMHINEQALQKLVNDNLLLNYADELGITALDDEIIKEYTSIDAFKVDGKFSKSRVEQLLRSQGINKKEFEKQIKKSIILRKLMKLLAMPASELESESIYAGKNLKNHLIIKKLTLDPSTVKVSDEELKKFWEAHKDMFKTPLSYTLDTIKVSASDIAVDDKELLPFYNENRLKFRNADGKVRTFEDAKEDVKKAFAQKKAKTLTLKKYLQYKKGKLQATDTITVDASNAPFDLRKLAKLKSGSYIKAIETKDGWITGKVKSINLPKDKSFEEAKDEALKAFKFQKGLKELEEKAKNELQNGISDGTDLGFLSANETSKIKDLSQEEANMLLKAVFTNKKEKDIVKTNNGVIAYEIKEQKLLDSDALNKEKSLLEKNIKALKSDSISQGLIQKLRKKYEIKQLVKITNKKEG